MSIVLPTAKVEAPLLADADTTGVSSSLSFDEHSHTVLGVEAVCALSTSTPLKPLLRL